jgi:hypothetical protein
MSSRKAEDGAEPSAAPGLQVHAGTFVVHSIRHGVQAEVAARLQVARVAHVKRYEVVASGFDDPSHYGNGAIRSSFTPETPGEWQVCEGLYGLTLSTWRGPSDETERAISWMQERFGGIRIRVRIQFAMRDRVDATSEPAEKGSSSPARP